MFQYLVHLSSCEYLDNSRIGISFVSVNVGDPLSLKCDSIATTKWLFNNSDKLPFNVEKKGNNLQIHNVILSNKGLYECSGVNERYEGFLAEYTVKVIGEF